MANIRMVTRTIKTTVCTVMTVRTDEGKVYFEEYTINGTFNTDEETLKALQKAFETETVKLVALQNRKEEETLYGMTEAYFIDHAEILPPRKVYETEAE